MERKSVKRLTGYGFLAACCVVWELISRHYSSPNVPGFLAVVHALYLDRAELLQQTAITLYRAAAGFFIALVTMLPLGILLGRVRVLGDFFEPVIDLLRPLPPLAVLPVVMLFAGAGSHAKIAVVCYGASVPILLNAIDGVRNLHPMLHRVSRSVGLHPLESMFLVDLPAALPHIVSGIRLSMAVAILIAVSSEMLLSADGLGTFLTRSQESFRIASELGGLVVIAACSLTLNNAMTALEARLLRWHYARVG